MHSEVQHALAGLSGGEARVLVLSGAGRGFCAGQDLGDRAVAPGAQGIDLGESIEKYYKPLVLALHSLPLPVIAAVNGVAAGAGANIALACDLVIAARSLRDFRNPGFSKHGCCADRTRYLDLAAAFVGSAWALGLTLLGNKLGAEQAAAWGMIWQCVDDADLGSAVDTIAQQFAAAPTRGLSWTKKAIRGSWQHSLEEQLDIERDAQRELGRSADYAEGVAAFVAKRTPRFTGR